MKKDPVVNHFIVYIVLLHVYSKYSDNSVAIQIEDNAQPPMLETGTHRPCKNPLQNCVYWLHFFVLCIFSVRHVILKVIYVSLKSEGDSCNTKVKINIICILIFQEIADIFLCYNVSSCSNQGNLHSLIKAGGRTRKLDNISNISINEIPSRGDFFENHMNQSQSLVNKCFISVFVFDRVSLLITNFLSNKSL